MTPSTRLLPHRCNWSIRPWPQTLRGLVGYLAPLQVVTKIWYTHLGYGRTKLAVEEMLAGLNGCCAVTMLIHWPRCRDDISWMHCAEEERALPQRYKDTGLPSRGRVEGLVDGAGGVLRRGTSEEYWREQFRAR